MLVRTNRTVARNWAYEQRLERQRTGDAWASAHACGSCEQPIKLAMRDGGIPADHRRIWSDLSVRCRKCPACLRARAALWRSRIRSEIERAPRSWFATFTLSPDNHFRVTCAVEAQLQIGGESLGELPADEAFGRRVAAIQPHFTRYLKRVRKASGSPLRYCLVAESHKSGLPHFHAVIHESCPDRPVRHKLLSEQWQLGFSSFKLCGPEASWYVAKYLSKQAMARVRASLYYGNGLKP